MSPPASITPPGYRDFTTAAWKAVKTGSRLDLDKAQRPRASGGMFLGRVVNWLRDRLFPDKRQAENMRVLNRFEAAAREQYPGLAGDRIHGVLRNLDDLPLAHRIAGASRIFQQLAGKSYQPQPTLQGEITEAKRLGYMRDIVGVDNDDAMSDNDFKYVVSQYNATMSDLHQRFPRLCNVSPPRLNRRDLGAVSATALGRHTQSTQQIRVRNISDQTWKDRTARSMAIGWSILRSPGIRGTLTHEYGHHLSLIATHPEQWYPRLLKTLKDNGVIAGKAFPGLYDDAEFNKAVKDNYRKTGCGKYATVNGREFVAEALACYMAPEYGTEAVPRLPGFMERWLRDSFPFLRRDEA